MLIAIAVYNLSPHGLRVHLNTSQTVPRRRRSVMSAIEVEKKFLVPSSTKKRLHTSFPSSTSEKIEDCYFGEELALNDMWLRKRNGEWELKTPLPSREKTISGPTVYREYAGQCVWSQLKRTDEKEKGLAPFAKLQTERTQMRLEYNSQPVTIVIDSCSSDDGFSYTIGEVEVMVDSESDVKDAEALLNTVIERYELQSGNHVRGKLQMYLQEKKTVLYRKLNARGLM